MLEKGLQLTKEVVVKPENLAMAMGSGDLPVLATPAMVAFMENAALSAVEDQLLEGNTTVGAMIQTTHLKPTALGDTVLVTATLLEVEGRKLTFSVVASDSQGKIGEGTHIRYVVDRNKFMEKLTSR